MYGTRADVKCKNEARGRHRQELLVATLGNHRQSVLDQTASNLVAARPGSGSAISQTLP